MFQVWCGTKWCIWELQNKVTAVIFQRVTGGASEACYASFHVVAVSDCLSSAAAAELLEVEDSGEAGCAFICRKAVTDELQPADVREAGCAQQLINLSRRLRSSSHVCPLGKFKWGDQTQMRPDAARRQSILLRALRPSRTRFRPLPPQLPIPPLAIAPAPTFCGITVAIVTQQIGSEAAAVVGAMATHTHTRKHTLRIVEVRRTQKQTYIPTCTGTWHSCSWINGVVVKMVSGSCCRIYFFFLYQFGIGAVHPAVWADWHHESFGNFNI